MALGDFYRLDEMADLCSDFGLRCRRPDPDTLEIELFEDAVLTFANMPGEGDTIAGFRGTPSHFHGPLHFMTGAGTYVEYDELESLLQISAGEIVVVSSYVAGALVDRWLSHRREPLDLNYLAADEELRVRPAASPSASGELRSDAIAATRSDGESRTTGGGGA